MSATQFDLGLRLAAHHHNTLIQRTSTQRFNLRADAMIVSVLASPGDHAGLWAAAWSTINGRPTTATASDPRPWSTQVRLWEEIAKSWVPWIRQCLTQDQAPQFVVADASAGDRIAASARKIVYSERVEADARTAARAYLIAHHSARSIGQQTIGSMTDILREHYITGADPLDENKLGLWAAWPVLNPGWDDPQVGIPPGADGTTAPLGKAWDKMTRQSDKGARAEMAAIFGQNVITQVRKLVTTRWDTLRPATRLYLKHPGPILGVTTHHSADEAKDFTYFMNAERTPGGRSQKARWVALSNRERSASRWKAALWAEDDLERRRGVASGDVVHGTGTKGRIFTTQPTLRVRPGDTLEFVCTTPVPATTLKVDGLFASGDALVLDVGQVELDGEIYAWPADQSVRSPMPAKVPWTHDREAARETFAPQVGDLLGEVEAMLQAPL